MTCDDEPWYMDTMSADLERGMAFVVSNWAGDATWLWGDRCSGTCNESRLTISNITITANDTPTPPPPVKFYDFGDACSSSHDDDCGSSCPAVSHCRWSWETTDPAAYEGHTAKCRCDI